MRIRVIEIYIITVFLIVTSMTYLASGKPFFRRVQPIAYKFNTDIGYSKYHALNYWPISSRDAEAEFDQLGDDPA
ncbi:hypothetical protein LSTR_LSTR013254 [Laodelphax striatellus]|uniref:Uncharacterized protein n=1 Tax=Laodelphax striatellus TaxID=195883 RepID=A0A482WML0_LAOST|nr:hypothetical protein LSTR_LSTR013254 [Laodelphax striatellus]